MRSNTVLAFLATSLFATTGSAVTENPGMSYGSYSSIDCKSGQQVISQADDGCHSFPGLSLKIWWFAPTCRAFVYRDSNCTPSSGEMQVYTDKCYLTNLYYSIRVFCH